MSIQTEGETPTIPRLSRRRFVQITAAGLVATWAVLSRHRVWASDGPGQNAMGPEVIIVLFSAAGRSEGPKRVAKVIKSDGAWRKQLPGLSYRVTRHADTEAPYTGLYWNLHEDGLFRCICCDNALFSSETKYDSGTGWPSFWAPLVRQNIETRSDDSLGMQRTAVACRRCDAHLGHVFDDGPKPTGLRYCMNSAALRFAKAE